MQNCLLNKNLSPSGINGRNLMRNPFDEHWTLAVQLLTVAARQRSGVLVRISRSYQTRLARTGGVAELSVGDCSMNRSNRRYLFGSAARFVTIFA
jgi:hypothetical protein